MSWDERVQKIVQTVEHDPDTKYGLDYADGYADGGHQMARWQRGALLSEGSIERAARALYETDREEYDGDKPWPPRPHFIEDMYRERARAALTAAIGDE